MKTQNRRKPKAERSERAVIYIAGPMHGIPEYNFPAFDLARDDLQRCGWDVVSPADLDRARGFDGKNERVVNAEFLRRCMVDDINAIMRADAIALLPGWEKSVGAQAEMHLAAWRGIKIILWPTMQDIFPADAIRGHKENEDILEEALRITRGDRQSQYGPPDQDFKRTAALWSALKGIEFTPSEVASFMIALKLSRQTHQNKRDNWVDVAGYARCGSLCTK